MKPAVAKRLREALDAARAVQEWVIDQDFVGYESDLLLRSAVERQLMIVGEALNHARRDEPEIVALLPSVHEWVSQRNFIIHVYAEVSNDIVWDTVVREIPELIEALQRALARHGDEDEDER